MPAVRALRPALAGMSPARLLFGLGLSLLLIGGAPAPRMALAQDATRAAPFPNGALVVVTASRGLNVRAEPSLTSRIVASLPAGAQAVVLSGPVDAEGVLWYELKLAADRSGWASAAYLALAAQPAGSPPAPAARTEAPPPASAAPAPGPVESCTVWVTQGAVVLRAAPSETAEALGRLPLGTTVTVLELPQLTSGDLWVKVSGQAAGGWTPLAGLQATGRRAAGCSEPASPAIEAAGYPDLPAGPWAQAGLLCAGLAGLFVVYRLTRVQHFASKLVGVLALGVTGGMAALGAAGSLWQWEPLVWRAGGFWSWVAAVYSVNSVVTGLVYGYDKWAAQTEGWRIPEATLHSLEFLGGWPGALIGQQVFRHKRRKLDYMALFALIVLSHGLFWGWYVWH